jgi:hypothetical protein
MLGEEAVGLEGRFPQKVFKGMRDMLGMSSVPAAAQATLDRFRLPSTLVPPSEAQATLGLKGPDGDEVRIVSPRMVHGRCRSGHERTWCTAGGTLTSCPGFELGLAALRTLHYPPRGGPSCCIAPPARRFASLEDSRFGWDGRGTLCSKRMGRADTARRLLREVLRSAGAQAPLLGVPGIAWCSTGCRHGGATY